MPPFLCSDVSSVHSINPTCCRYILQSLHEHCKSTNILNFLLKILKDCDNLMSLGTRSHIFGPRNGMDSVPYLMEFTLYHFSKNRMGVRRVQKYLKWMQKNHARLCNFYSQFFVRFYDVLIRSCLFLVIPEMLKVCFHMLFLEPFQVYDYFVIKSSAVWNIHIRRQHPN